MIADAELTLHQALQGPETEYWQKAIDEELKGLKEKGAFNNDTCPEDIKPLESRYVLNKKHNPNGMIKKYKARLVAKGCCQEYGKRLYGNILTCYQI